MMIPQSNVRDTITYAIHEDLKFPEARSKVTDGVWIQVYEKAGAPVPTLRVVLWISVATALRG